MPNNTYWQCVTYGNGVFSALAGGTAYAAYSPNGIVWSNATGLPSANWGGMAFGNGIFAAVAYDSDIAAYSINGIVWNSSVNASNALWYSTAFAGGLFVAPAIGSTNASYSANGINWNSSASPLPDQDTFYTVAGNTIQSKGYIPSGLAGYWKLNDGSGAIAADSSGNGYPLTNLPSTDLPTWGTDYLTYNGTSQYSDGGSVTLPGLNYYIDT